MGGRWSKLAFEPPMHRPPLQPCPHNDKPKIARDVCNACYQRWKREPPLAAPLTPEDRRADAAAIVDSLYATFDATMISHLTAEMLSRSMLKIR